jgi:hypothetical protein
MQVLSPHISVVWHRWRDVTKLNEAMDSLEYGTSDKATYLKITLSKLIFFMSSMCCQDYLSQHSSFVMSEGNRDRYTDSWTTIEGTRWLDDHIFFWISY